jgi:NAD(P)-dependent dehydrogenase (short-subunit alcohol dehydrogenase family)
MTFAEDCLADRLIVVTGASSGIGREAAMLLARCGARLVLLGRDESRLQQTLSELSGEGHSTRMADLTDAELTADLIQAIAKEEGVIHGVFHAAGTTLTLPAKLHKNHHLDDVFGASMHGAFGIARAASKKGVLTDGGSLVFMSSVAATRGRSGITAYCASKAAVDGLARALSAELAGRRIRVNSIRAGGVNTPMLAAVAGNMSEAGRKEYEDLHLMGVGEAEDVANAAVFLLSDASRWITGSSMAVDGGAAVR